MMSIGTQRNSEMIRAGDMMFRFVTNQLRQASTEVPIYGTVTKLQEGRDAE
jgi:hypothetical protein